MPVERMFKITSLGKKIAGRIQMESRDPVLDGLYNSPGKSATTSELESLTGYNRGQLMSELKQFVNKGYVTELSRGGV